MSQYYVLTLDPNVGEIFKFIDKHSLRFEAHLNRTRFWIDDPEVEMMFLLKWASVCPKIEERKDGDYAIR